MKEAREMPIGRLYGLLTAVLGAVLAIGIPATAGAVGTIEIRVSPLTLEVGALPKSLPRHAMAPIAFQTEGEIGLFDGTQPPALTELTIDIDRNGAINPEGFAVCKRSQLDVLGASAARRACAGSVVGGGTAHIEVSS